MVSQWDLRACNIDSGKIRVAGRPLTGTDEDSFGFVRIVVRIVTWCTLIYKIKSSIVAYYRVNRT